MACSSLRMTDHVPLPSRTTRTFFTFMWLCIVTNFFVIKPTICTNFTNLFCHETPHVSDISSVHHQEFIHCKLSNGIYHTDLQTAFEQDQDWTAVTSWSCSKAVYRPALHIPLLSVQWIHSWWWTDELSEICKVSRQNKFVKRVHLVGFITEKLVTMHGHMNVKLSDISVQTISRYTQVHHSWICDNIPHT
jgi:hypothetical protein